MADDYSIKIRIGAGLDTRSFDATMGEAQQRAKKSAQAIAQITRTAERQSISVYRQSAKERVDSARSAEREIATEQRRQLATQRAAMKQFNAEWKRDKQEVARAEKAIQQQGHREAMYLFRAEQAAKRAELRKTEQAERSAQRERERFAFRTSHRATRFLFPQPEGMLGYGRRVGGELMRGMGMDWSLAAGLQRNAANQEASVKLSNQGYIPGQGKFEDRIGAAALRSKAQGIAGKFGFSEGDVLGAMSRFTDVTGDLKTARDTIEQIALLSSATGTNIEDAASAAADMSMQLGDIPNKSEHVARLLSVAAMGGKQGAVEMKELAKTIPLIASQAASLGGDRESNIGKLLAVTQTARQFGGAGNAFKAATATAGMVGSLQTPARVAAFREHFKRFTGGRKDIYDSKGNLRDIQEIIKDSVIAAGSDKDRQVEFNKMWGNIRAGKAVGGFLSIAQQAGGGEAGSRAIDAQFKKFTAALDPAEQAKLSASAVDVQARKAQQFQIQLDSVAQNLQAELLPVLTELEPKIKSLAEAFAGMITFTANHLPSAIMLAVTASIARAGIESSFRMGIDRMLGASSPAQATWKAGFTSFGGGLMTVTQLLGTLSIAMGSTMAALDLLNNWIEGKAGSGSKALNTVDESLRVGLSNIDSRTDMSDAEKAQAKAEVVRVAQKRLAYEKSETVGGLGSRIVSGLTFNSHAANVRGEYAETEGKYQAMAEGFDAEAKMRRGFSSGGGGGKASGGVDPNVLAQAMVQAMSGVTLKTNVTNAKDFQGVTGGAPKVDPSGRTPAPGNRAP